LGSTIITTVFGVPIAFSIFGLDIAWYGIMAIIGFLSGMLCIRFILKRKKQNPDIAIEILLVVLPMAIIGARLWYVAFSPGVALFDIRSGGLAWHGGVIGSVLGLLVYSYFRKVNVFVVLDSCAVAVPIGHAFGRIGNQINVEIYGRQTNIKWFPFAQKVGSEYFVNIAFFEMILLILLAIGLFLWYRKNDKIGMVLPFYLIGYGIIRLILEPLRNETFILQGGGVQISVLMSVLLLLSGLVILGFMIYKYYYKKIPATSKNTYSLSIFVPPQKNKTKIEPNDNNQQDDKEATKAQDDKIAGQIDIEPTDTTQTEITVDKEQNIDTNQIIEEIKNKNN